MRLIMMGPPGVGKGTQAKMIQQQFNVPHVSTGDIFRGILKTKGELSTEVNKYLDKGLLVPDELTNKVVETRFENKDIHVGFVFDGYPRNVVQAEAFETYLDEHNWKVDLVINIQADDDLIVKRLSGRRVCPTCGRIYHLESNPPKVVGICDIDQTPLIQREDDKPETIVKRLNIYHQETKPLIDFYEAKGLLKTIDGSGGIEDANKQVLKLIGDLKWLLLNQKEKLN